MKRLEDKELKKICGGRNPTPSLGDGSNGREDRISSVIQSLLALINSLFVKSKDHSK